MKRLIFALILSPILASAQLPYMIDTTTLTTNSRISMWQLSITNTTLPFTNGEITLRNTNFVDVGALFPAVFITINSNFAYFAQFTNGSQTPWVSDINAGGFGVTNIANIGSISPIIQGNGQFFGGTSNTFSSNPSTTNSDFIVGGEFNDIFGSVVSGIFGGHTNVVGGSGGTPTTGSYIIGGVSNHISLPFSGHADYSEILNGWDVWIQQAGDTVIADRETNPFTITTADMMAIRETNGVAINTNTSSGFDLQTLRAINASAYYQNGLPFSGGGSGIAITNGHGTGISLTSTTMLSDASGLLIPNMSSDILPYGTASASTESTTAFQAFTNSNWTSDSETAPWIQWQAPSPLMVTGIVLSLSGGGPTNVFQSSMDGVNWTTLRYADSYPNGTPQGVAPTEGIYFRWTFPNDTAYSLTVGNLNIYGDVINEVQSSSLVAITTPRGVAINVTNYQGDTLDVGGNANAEGFSIYHIPLNQIFATAYPSNITVTGASGVATLLNTSYTMSGSFDGFPAYLGPGTPPNCSIIININGNWTMSTNVNFSVNPSTTPTYTNGGNLLGYYSTSGTGPTNQPLAAKVSLPLLNGLVSTYSTNVTLIAATSLQINFSPAMPDTSYIVTSPNDLAGSTITTRGTSSFVVSFTSATLTSQTIEGAIIHR